MGTRLKVYREKRGITQADAARNVGMPHSVLGRLERGESNVVHPGAAALIRLLSLRLVLIPEHLLESVNALIKKSEDPRS